MRAVFANGLTVWQVHVGVILEYNVTQQLDLAPRCLVLLAKSLALCFEDCLGVPQRLGLALEFGDDGVLAIGFFRNLRRTLQQVVKLGDKLVVARHDLLCVSAQESIVRRELGVAAVPLEPVKETISA
jgi:hypothetical protein